MTRNQPIGLAIAIFWLTMTALLLYREQAFGPAPTALSSAAVFPSESWMAIEVADGPRVGQAHMKSTLESRDGQPGQRFFLEAELHLQLSGKETDFVLEGDVWRTEKPPRVEFQFSVESGGHEFEIAGKVANGRLESEVRSAGETLPMSLPMNEDILFSNGLGTALDFPLLEEGEELRVDSFDPLTLSKSRARIRYLSKEMIELDSGSIETRRLRVDLGGIESFVWIDAAGQVARAETPVGLVLQRLDGPSEHDITQEAKGASEDFLRFSSITPAGHRPFRNATHLHFRVSGLGDRQLPVDETQVRREEGRYLVTSPPPPEALEEEQATAEWAPFLVGDPFIQADHPGIQSQASQIVAETRDPWQKALRINEWVFTHLDKESVMSVPSALEVLSQKRGDCNEHTVLFAALARASGIPTRIAIGLVWSDELDGFYYHAWPEVHLDNRWIWMDPTLDQPIADATHIKLLNGGIEAWPQLLGFLGNLDLEILAISGEPHHP